MFVGLFNLQNGAPLLVVPQMDPYNTKCQNAHMPSAHMWRNIIHHFLQGECNNKGNVLYIAALSFEVCVLTVVRIEY